MSEQELQDLIEQLSQQRSQKPGGRSFGISNDYNSPGAVSQWIWGNGYSQIGPMANNAPPIVKQILQQQGMKMDPTQYRSVGGYTPQFADAVNAAVYPGMNFRTGDQSMGELIGQPMQMGGYKLDNKIEDQIANEKAKMSQSNYKLTPEEEQYIEQAIKARYGRQ